MTMASTLGAATLSMETAGGTLTSGVVGTFGPPHGKPTTFGPVATP